MKNRMGRPPKSGDETLAKTINIRLTLSELAAYDLAAEAASLARSEWIRAVLSKAAKPYLSKKPPRP
jgi:hypothetical protein